MEAWGNLCHPRCQCQASSPPTSAAICRATSILGSRLSCRYRAPLGHRPGAHLEHVRDVVFCLRMVHPVHGHGRGVVVDRHVNLTARGHLNSAGRTAAAGEEVHDQLGVDVQEELGIDHRRFLFLDARAWRLFARFALSTALGLVLFFRGLEDRTSPGRATMAAAIIVARRCGGVFIARPRGAHRAPPWLPARAGSRGRTRRRQGACASRRPGRRWP